MGSGVFYKCSSQEYELSRVNLSVSIYPYCKQYIRYNYDNDVISINIAIIVYNAIDFSAQIHKLIAQITNIYHTIHL